MHLLLHKYIAWTLALFLTITVGMGANAQNCRFNSLYYSIDDGLPSSETYSVTQDKNGLIWIGTDGGVSTFNGYEFKNYTTFDGLKDNVVFNVYEDAKGRMWYKSYTGGIGFISDGKVHEYPHNDSLQKQLNHSYISEMRIDSNNTIWFTTSHFGYGKIDAEGNIDNRVSRSDSTYEVSYEIVNGVPRLITFITPENEFGTSLEIWNRTDNKLIKAIDSERHIAVMKYGVMEEYGYFSYDRDGQWHLGIINDTTFISTETMAAINWVYRDKKERLWICPNQHGVFIYENMTAFKNGEPHLFHFFEHKNVGGIFEDKYGGIWIAFQNQNVVYLPGSDILNYSSPGGAINNRVVGLTQNSKKQFFYATENGKVFEIDSLNNHHIIFNEQVGISEIDFTPEDELFICLLSDQAVRTKQQESSNPFQNIKFFGGRNALSGSNGSSYIISGTHFSEIIDNRVVNMIDDRSPTTYFYTLFEDSDQQVWLGGKRGLSLYENHEIKNFDCLPIDKEYQTLKAIEQLGKDTLIVAIEMYGLFFINTKRPTPHAFKFIPLYGKHINHIHVDWDRDIWLSTNNGLVKLHPKGDRYVQTTIKASNGLSSNQVNKVLSAENTLYVATSNGLDVFDKRDLNLNTIPPELLFESLKINEVDRNPDSILHLSHDQNTLEFSFTGICYRIPGMINYKYRLSGIDKKWKESRLRSIRYPALPHGNYTFEVKCANEDGVWSEPYTIIIIISPPFWKTWWFILIASILIVSGIVFLIKRREYKNKKKLKTFKARELQKRKIIEAELTALRAQMNPHFTFNTLNSIQSFIVNSKSELAIDYIAEFANLIRLVLENSKSPLIRLADELNMLKLYLKLENMRFSNEIDVKIKMDDRIDPDFHEIPSMVIQPFIENAIIHGLTPKLSGNKTIILEFVLEETGITCMIEDNGIGRARAAKIKLEKENHSKSLGMKITQDRLELLCEQYKKELSFSVIDLYDEDKSPAGTRIVLKFFR